jgi:hypothetical protein
MLRDDHAGRPFWYRLAVSRRFVWFRRVVWCGVFVAIAGYGWKALRRAESPAVNSRHVLKEWGAPAAPPAEEAIPEAKTTSP